MNDENCKVGNYVRCNEKNIEALKGCFWGFLYWRHSMHQLFDGEYREILKIEESNLYPERKIHLDIKGISGGYGNYYFIDLDFITKEDYKQITNETLGENKMNDFKERLVEEIVGLEYKISKLSDFMEKYNFDEIIKNSTQKKLLVIQLSQMNAYLNTLKLRLEILEQDTVDENGYMKYKPDIVDIETVGQYCGKRDRDGFKIYKKIGDNIK